MDQSPGGTARREKAYSSNAHGESPFAHLAVIIIVVIRSSIIAIGVAY
jgi:hypothetical protein